MKKMIKTAAVIMSTIMVFSMTACAKKADPKEVFDAAVKKNFGADILGYGYDNENDHDPGRGDHGHHG